MIGPHRLLAAAARVIALLALVIAGASAHAQPSEDAVKAAFLPKFPRYVGWPAGAQPGGRVPFVVCVIGRDPFGRLLDEAAASERVEGHPVSVRRLEGPEGAAGCHLAYVRGANAEETARMLAILSRRPILTVTDHRAGATRGMIHFVVAGGRVRFYIDQVAAGQRGLSMSARLLALAIGVRERG